MKTKTLARSPLRDIQTPCVVSGAHPSPPLYPLQGPWHLRAPVFNGSPACGFTSQLLHSFPALQAEPTPLQIVNYPCNDLQDANDGKYLNPSPFLFPTYRSLDLSTSPPALYPRAECGGTFSLAPAAMNRGPMFTHLAVNSSGNDSMDDPSSSSTSSGEGGLPDDMRDMLRQLDDLASWVKAASSSTDCISNTNPIMHSHFLPGLPGIDADSNRTPHRDRLKGKNRPTPASLFGTCPDLVVCFISQLLGSLLH